MIDAAERDTPGVFMDRSEHRFHVPNRELAAYHYPAPAHLHCAQCGQDQPRSGIIRRITARGERIPLCYDCYEQQTGGQYDGRDEYWDGYGWIPLAKGE